MVVAMEQLQQTYTIAEAAVYLRVSEKTIRRWIKRNLMRTSKSMRKKIIPGEDVQKFIDKTC